MEPTSAKKKRRRVLWILAALVSLPVLYALSYGPSWALASYCARHGYGSPHMWLRILLTLYVPLIDATNSAPEPVRTALWAYFHFWTDL